MRHHGPQKPEGYEERLHDYMERELHPETAKHIGEIVFHSPMGSSEFAMSIILQMQLDHLRKDTAMQQQSDLPYDLPDAEGNALGAGMTRE